VTGEPQTVHLLATVLRGGAIPWAAFGLSSADFLGACDEQGVTGLVHERVRALAETCDWPRDLRDAIAAEVRGRAVSELLRREELIAVVEALAAEDISPIFLKGTALAYSLYASPSSRPRIDNDILICCNQVDGFRSVMKGLGYAAPVHCDGDLLFCQFPLAKTTLYGLEHRFDCHWKISTQSVFANVLTYGEVDDRTVALPALGARARTLAAGDALLLACIHSVMHHRNADVLVWMYDIHLLASALSNSEFDRFSEAAVAKGVATICGQQLRRAQKLLGARISDAALDALNRQQGREASAVYLRADRRWIDELHSSLRALPRWRDRLRLVREVVLPGPAYMLNAYGLAGSVGVALLPLLYVHRVLFGGWKLVGGLK
jgi:hypothetical protein